MEEVNVTDFASSFNKGGVAGEGWVPSEVGPEIAAFVLGMGGVGNGAHPGG